VQVEYSWRIERTYELRPDASQKSTRSGETPIRRWIGAPAKWFVLKQLSQMPGRCDRGGFLALPARMAISPPIHGPSTALRAGPSTALRAGPAKRSVWLWVVAALWLGGAITGLWVVWAYDNTPGTAAVPHKHWPSDTKLARSRTQPTLVLLAHPQCFCTRASLAELAEVLGRARHAPKTYVVFLKPSGFADGWEKTDLWRTAAALPNVTVLRDDDGREMQRFGAVTSGQTFLYDVDGELIFSGGITGARAHAGDNAGRAALLALLDRKEPRSRATSVFGCSLFTARGES
jgi:hypothetical protein